MKRFLLLFGTLLFVCSCTSEMDQMFNGARDGVQRNRTKFYASTESRVTSSPATKVYADENMKVLWNADDRISIFNKSTYNYQYAFTGEDGDTAGDFEDVTPSGSHTGTKVDYITAVYPYSKNNEMDNEGGLTMELPAEQAYKAHSFGIGANSMIAVTEGDFLAFKNIGGYLSLRLYGDQVAVSKITIQGNNGEKIAGKAGISMPLNGVPTATMDASATDAISVVCNPAVTLGTTAEEYTEFWFVIPPVTFENGFTITVTDAQGGSFTKSTTRSFTVSRNKLDWMNPIKVEPSYVKSYVDLGLPSGLKWATCNVGANRPEEYGDFFAWGETEPKQKYSGSTYKWCNGALNALTKYNNNDSYGTIDNKMQLDLSDDAARANWGGNWRMPTDAEWTELRTECTWTWTTQNGKNGRLVTGPNGNSIFLPATGYQNVDYLDYAGLRGYYRSSSLNTDNSLFAYYVYFSSGGVDRSDDYRVYGLSVRPVYDENPTQKSVDLGLPSGLKWATCNVGADAPEEYGDYFAWGETEPKSEYTWVKYKFRVSGDSWDNVAFGKYNTESGRGTVDNKTVLELSDDAARANWGGSWRMPTYAEWEELRTKCTWSWTTQNGKNGSLVTGPNGNSIFLPAAGYRDDTGFMNPGSSLINPGSFGNYWSSSLNTDAGGYPSSAYGAWFSSVDVPGTGGSSRCYGKSVRPVYADPVSVSGVSLDRTEVTLYTGNSTQLEATVLPANASEKGVTWSSNNPSVASVSTDGLVSANQAGNAVITVTTIDGGFKATCQVTVKSVSQYEAVDLGLPSGLKWATCNVGANSPEEYGDYFAWGETEPKENYDWSTYKWCNGSYNTLTKYNTSSNYGTVDNKMVLDFEDDAARANWGANWRIPTDANWTELITECTWAWTSQNGKYGSLVTGPNGKSIFLPATGSRGGTSLHDAGTYGDYRSSSLYTERPTYSSDMGFGSGGVYRGDGYRCYGHAVRPVYGGDPFSVSSVSLDRTEITLYAGFSTQLEANVLPAYAREKGVTWSSNNPSVASVSTDGLVSANQAGNAVITVTTIDGGFEATCQVTVNAPLQYEAVDLGLPSGLKWATCNVGASSPEEYGDFFAWGEIEPKENYVWSTYKWCNGSGSTLTKYNNSSSYGTVDNKTVLDLSDDAARANWGGNWRMPTDADWTELRTECTWTWTRQNGKNGRLVIGPNGNSIFLPAAGYRTFDYLDNAGSRGDYWSSSLYTDYPDYPDYACTVTFISYKFYRGDNLRHNGLPVRPVTE